MLKTYEPPDIFRSAGSAVAASGSAPVLEELAAAAAAMPEGFLVLDPRKNVLICNKALARIFNLPVPPLGKSFAEAFGQKRSGDETPEKEALSPPVYSREFCSHILAGAPAVSAEISLSKGAEREDYLLLAVSHHLSGGVYTFCCMKKVSDLLSFHAAVRRGREELERTVLEHNRELMRVNAQLRLENAERSAVAQALRRAESRYRDIFDNATEGIFQWTPDWRIISANMSFARTLGYSTVNNLLHSASDPPFHFCMDQDVAQELVTALENTGSVVNFEFQAVRQDGAPVWASMNARRVAGPGGRTNYYEAFIENITVRKSTEEKLVYQAFHDPLTGLANRSLFHDRLRMALRRAGRQPGYRFAVLYLDLNRFKMVNDSFGHNAGDDVLCHTAVSILSCVREVDTVARFGGDEFAVLIEDTQKNSQAIRVAKRIIDALSCPFCIDDQEVTTGGSVGIVLRAERYEQPEDILRDADTAMYRAKAQRHIKFKVFSQKMREETMESISLESDLRQGVKNAEFFMEYQPIVHMDTGALHGYEALIRWKRKDTVMGPGQFIPVAEETGLIKPLGLYIIERVCRRIAAWTAEGGPAPFVMHVNISGRQLIYPTFPREVQRILERTAIDPRHLCFEITESVLLDNGGACIQGIQQIRELGIRFCLDDFGTGFSSLSYLRHLPLDSIKVDRSFVSDIETDAHSVAIVRNLVCLGQDLGLAVVVEGIERKTQVNVLSAAGCSLAQGYFFHRPMSAVKAEELLARNPGDISTLSPGAAEEYADPEDPML